MPKDKAIYNTLTPAFTLKSVSLSASDPIAIGASDDLGCIEEFTGEISLSHTQSHTHTPQFTLVSLRKL